MTALTRVSSEATTPSGTVTVKVDYENEQSIVEALKGQQFLVITLSSRAPPELMSRIIQAAAKAGVKWVIPNAFGSDIANEALATEDMYGAGALKRCQEVEAAGMSYVAFSGGFWYEWSLSWGEVAFGFDIAHKRVTFFDDGKTPITVSTWGQNGQALSSLLSLPESGVSPSLEQWRNKPLYFSSFTISQRDMLDSLHRVLGTSDDDWTITKQPSRERYAEGLAQLKGGDRLGFIKAMYTRTFFQNGDGDYTKKGLADKILKLPQEDLDEATKRAVDMAAAR